MSDWQLKLVQDELARQVKVNEDLRVEVEKLKEERESKAREVARYLYKADENLSMVMKERNEALNEVQRGVEACRAHVCLGSYEAHELLKAIQEDQLETGLVMIDLRAEVERLKTELYRTELAERSYARMLNAECEVSARLRGVLAYIERNLCDDNEREANLGSAARAALDVSPVTKKGCMCFSHCTCENWRESEGHSTDERLKARTPPKCQECGDPATNTYGNFCRRHEHLVF